MTVNELIVILQNRLVMLTEAKKAAVSNGDLERLIQLEGDLLTTINTIESLQKTISKN